MANSFISMVYAAVKAAGNDIEDMTPSEAIEIFNGLSDEDKLREEERERHGGKKLTPAEKIASVHIDFDRDNLLPELNESELEKIGKKDSKPVLLKKNVIDRNRTRHDDLTDSDFEQIIAKALYSPSEVFPANKEKPYFHFAKIIEVNSKGKPEIGLVLLDVDDHKDNFEIVHAQFIRQRSYKAIKKKV